MYKVELRRGEYGPSDVGAPAVHLHPSIYRNTEVLIVDYQTGEGSVPVPPPRGNYIQSSPTQSSWLATLALSACKCSLVDMFLAFEALIPGMNPG